MSIGDALTGIATGYISEALRDSRQADQERYDRIKLAENQYYNVDLPNYKREEKLRDANIAYINAELGPVYANYFDAQGITLDSTNTRSFVKQFKDAGFSETEKLEIESTITGRRKERQEDLDEKLAMIRDRESRKSGGIGDNIAKMFFSKDEEDISKVGVKQGTDMEAPPQDTFTPMSELLGTGGTYDVTNNRHAVLQSQFDTDFRRFFVNDINQPTISFAKGSAQYDLSNELLKGYDEAVKKGFKKGKYEYARLNYIDQELKREGITGYNTGFDTAVETTTSSIPEDSGEAGVVPGDGKKFDTSDTSQVDVKQTVEPEVKVTDVDNGSSVAVINDFREFRAKVNDSPSLSDDEKIKKIEQAKERLKQRLTELGTFNESVLRQL